MSLGRSDTYVFHTEAVARLLTKRVDVFAIERGDEGAMEQLDRGMCDLVSALLDQFDIESAPLDIVPRRDRRRELARAGHQRLGVLIESSTALRAA